MQSQYTALMAHFNLSGNITIKKKTSGVRGSGQNIISYIISTARDLEDNFFLKFMTVFSKISM